MTRRIELCEIRIGVIETLGHECSTGSVSAGFEESLRTQQAAVAAPAWRAVGARIVAAVGEAVVEAELHSRGDDLRLRQAQQRREDAQSRAFHAGLRGERGQALERLEVLRAAVRIAGVVERVDADDDRGRRRTTSAQASASERNTVLRAGT